MKHLAPDDLDKMCRDKTGRHIKEGDRVRVDTISLAGVFRVVRKPDRKLYFVITPRLEEGEKSFVSHEMVAGFFPATLEVVEE